MNKETYCPKCGEDSAVHSDDQEATFWDTPNLLPTFEEVLYCTECDTRWCNKYKMLYIETEDLS